MSTNMDLGPLNIVCDAPRWAIVAAIADHLDFSLPCDRRWIKWYKPVQCSCGRDVNGLVEFEFTMRDNSREFYELFQCGCGTMYWRKART